MADLQRPTLASLPSRILRLHRAETSQPVIHEWTDESLIEAVDHLMNESTTAESVAVLQVAPIGLRSIKTASGLRQAKQRIADLAGHCRTLVRSYDLVGVSEGFTVTVIMWGVAPDASIPRSLAQRLLGPGLDGMPIGISCVIGAAIGKPRETAEGLVRTSKQAVAQARWTAKEVVVLGGRPAAEMAFDARAGVDAALRQLRDSRNRGEENVAMRIMLRSGRRRRSDFFQSPSCNLVDHLMVTVDAVAALLERPPISWDRLHVDVPLVALRASNTTPRVVEAVAAELRDPDQLVLRLTGPGGPEMLDVVDELLVPLRERGVAVERVWDYQVGGNSAAEAGRATMIRVTEEVTKRYIDRAEPETILAKGPMELAHSLGADVIIEGVASHELATSAENCGVRYLSGLAIGQVQYQPLSGVTLSAAA